MKVGETKRVFSTPIILTIDSNKQTSIVRETEIGKIGKYYYSIIAEVKRQKGHASYEEDSVVDWFSKVVTF